MGAKSAYPIHAWIIPYQVSSGPVILLKINLESGISLRNIKRRVVDRVLKNISPSKFL